MKVPPIVIIYNPYSTGPSKEQAFLFAKQLKAAKKSIDVTCVATKHAGHSEEMAREYALRGKPCRHPCVVGLIDASGVHEHSVDKQDKWQQ